MASTGPFQTDELNLGETVPRTAEEPTEAPIAQASDCYIGQVVRVLPAHLAEEPTRRSSASWTEACAARCGQTGAIQHIDRDTIRIRFDDGRSLWFSPQSCIKTSGVVPKQWRARVTGAEGRGDRLNGDYSQEGMYEGAPLLRQQGEAASGVLYKKDGFWRLSPGSLGGWFYSVPSPDPTPPRVGWTAGQKLKEVSGTPTVETAPGDGFDAVFPEDLLNMEEMGKFSFPFVKKGNACWQPVLEDAAAAASVERLKKLNPEESLLPEGYVEPDSRVCVVFGLGRVHVCKGAGEERLPHSTSVLLTVKPLDGLRVLVTCEVTYTAAVLPCPHNLRFEAPCTTSPGNCAEAWSKQKAFITVDGKPLDMEYRTVGVVDLHESAKEKGAKVSITASKAGTKCHILSHCPAEPNKRVCAHFVFTSIVLASCLDDGRRLVCFEVDIQGCGFEEQEETALTEGETLLRLVGPILAPDAFPLATSLRLAEERDRTVIWATEECVKWVGQAAVTVYAPMVLECQATIPETLYSACRCPFPLPNGVSKEHWLARVTVPAMAELGTPILGGTTILWVSVDQSYSTAQKDSEGVSVLDRIKDFTLRLVEQSVKDAETVGCNLLIGVQAFDHTAEVLLFMSARDPRLRPRLEKRLATLAPSGTTSFAAAAKGRLNFMSQQAPRSDREQAWWTMKNQLLADITPTTELHFFITDGRDPYSELPRWENKEETLRRCIFAVVTPFGDRVSAARFAQYAPDGGEVVAAMEPNALQVPASLGIGASRPMTYVNIHDDKGLCRPSATGTWLFYAQHSGKSVPISFGPPLRCDEESNERATFAWKAAVSEGDKLYICADQPIIELKRPGRASYSIDLREGPLEKSDGELMREFLALPCGDAHWENRDLQNRMRTTWSIRFGLPCALTCGIHVSRLDPEIAVQMQGIPTPNGLVSKIEVPARKSTQTLTWVALLGLSLRPSRICHTALRGRGSGDSSDEEEVNGEEKHEAGPGIRATRKEVHQEYLSPFSEFIPFLHVWPAMTRRAGLNLQSVRACKQHAQEEGLLGLALLLQDLLNAYESVLSVHQKRYDLLVRCLFVRTERSLLGLCQCRLETLPGIDYDPQQSLADNVRKVTVRFPLPADHMTVTLEKAQDYLKMSARPAGTCGALQVKISPHDPDALIFTSIGGRSLFSIPVQWGHTLASRLLEQALEKGQAALGEEWLMVKLTKQDGSTLDPQQITPLRPKEFHSKRAE